MFFSFMHILSKLNWWPKNSKDKNKQRCSAAACREVWSLLPWRHFFKGGDQCCAYRGLSFLSPWHQVLLGTASHELLGKDADLYNLYLMLLIISLPVCVVQSDVKLSHVMLLIHCALRLVCPSISKHLSIYTLEKIWQPIFTLGSSHSPSQKALLVILLFPRHRDARASTFRC